MARREDYLLSRLLLTDGTISFEQLSNVLMKWHEDSPRSLLQSIIDEGLISEDEGRGLMMCIKKLTEQGEAQSSLAQLDFILCQLIIRKKMIAAELVNEYQRRTTQRGGCPIAEALLRDGHLAADSFMELKKMAEQIFYRRRIVAIIRGKERLSGIFRSPGRDEPAPAEDPAAKGGMAVSEARTDKSGIQKVITDVRADTSKQALKKKRRTQTIPNEFGQYQIIEEIASGGMGTVYKARHRDLGRIVALKVLHEEEQTLDRIKRFRREAEAAGRLKHPNIVGIYEVGAVNGRHFFAMDCIDGIPMSTLIKGRKHVELEDYLNIAAELARAVHYAHEQGVIHRDLKPANVIIDMEGHPQITDFGLAKILDTHSRLTKSDTIIGTPFYMAPEQTRGENDRIGVQTDIWALGVVLYEMLTKRLPFIGRSSIELYHKINHAEPAPPRKLVTGLPREIEYITMKALSKEPEERYPSAEAMAEDIEKYLEGEELVMHDPPRWLKMLRRWFRYNKWLVVIAAMAILLGWLCGWYLLSLDIGDRHPKKDGKEKSAPK